MENENLNDSLKRQKCIKSSLTSFFDSLKSALPIVKVPDEFDDSDDDSDQENEDSECSSD